MRDYITTIFNLVVGLVDADKIVYLALIGLGIILVWQIFSLLTNHFSRLASRCRRISNFLNKKGLSSENYNKFLTLVAKMPQEFIRGYKTFEHASYGLPSDYIKRFDSVDVEVNGGILNHGKSLVKAFIYGWSIVLFILCLALQGTETALTGFALADALLVPVLFLILAKVLYFIFNAIKQQQYRVAVDEFNEMLDIMNDKIENNDNLPGPDVLADLVDEVPVAPAQEDATVQPVVAPVALEDVQEELAEVQEEFEEPQQESEEAAEPQKVQKISLAELQAYKTAELGETIVEDKVEPVEAVEETPAVEPVEEVVSEDELLPEDEDDEENYESEYSQFFSDVYDTPKNEETPVVQEAPVEEPVEEPEETIYEAEEEQAVEEPAVETVENAVDEAVLTETPLVEEVESTEIEEAVILDEPIEEAVEVQEAPVEKPIGELEIVEEEEEITETVEVEETPAEEKKVVKKVQHQPLKRPFDQIQEEEAVMEEKRGRGRPKKVSEGEIVITNDKQFEEVLQRAEKLMRKSEEALSASQAKRVEKALKELVDAMTKYKEEH